MAAAQGQTQHLGFISTRHRAWYHIWPSGPGPATFQFITSWVWAHSSIQYKSSDCPIPSMTRGQPSPGGASSLKVYKDGWPVLMGSLQKGSAESYLPEEATFDLGFEERVA